MTLLPTENRNVHGLETALGEGTGLNQGLRRDYDLSNYCSAPGCFEEATDGHHLFRRSAIGGDFWWVHVIESDAPEPFGPRAKVTDRVLPNVVGLCRFHHRQVTNNEVWIRLTEFGFEWLEKWHGDPILEEKDSWEGFGLLDPQPGKTEKEEVRPGAPCPRCHRRVPEPHKGIKPRTRVTYSFKVPKDAREGGEDGHEILKTLVAANAEKLGRAGQPEYFTHIEVHHAFLEAGLEPVE